jgi:hypothetical protein
MSNIRNIQSIANKIRSSLNQSLPISSRSTSVTQVRALLEKLETADEKVMRQATLELEQMYHRLTQRQDLGRGKTQKAWIKKRHGEDLKELIGALKKLPAEGLGGVATSLRSDDKKGSSTALQSFETEDLVSEARLLLKFFPKKWLRANPLRQALQKFVRDPKTLTLEEWIETFFKLSLGNNKIGEFIKKLGIALAEKEMEQALPVRFNPLPIPSTHTTKKVSVLKPPDLKQEIPPPLASREKTPDHLLYVMPPGSKNEAAAFAEIYLRLAETHKPSVYLDDPSSLPFLQSDITQLLQQGGTLVINLANFAAAQMASLNGLFAKLPKLGDAQGKPNGLRIIGLLAHSQLSASHPTGDFISRFRTCHETKLEEKMACKPIVWVENSDFKTSDLTDTIELAGSNQWRSILESQFRKAAKLGKKKIIIAHPPEGKHLKAVATFLQALQSRYPDIEIIVKKTSPERVQIPKFDEKNGASFLIVNQANFHRLFCEGIGYDSKTNTLKPQPALIGSQPKPLRLCLAADVTSSQIEFLRQEHSALTLEKAPTRNTVQQVEYGTPKFKSLFQPTADQKAPVLIDVRSPVYTSNDLFELFGKPPEAALAKGFLLRCLQQGRTVCIRGLEERPEFKILLQSLLSKQPHVLWGDQLVRFDPSKLQILLIDEPTKKITATKRPEIVKDTFGLCKNLLENHRALFLQGPPGAGKSFTMQKLVKQLSKIAAFNPGAIGRRHTADFKNKLLAWADAKPKSGYVFLTVDEANLAEPEFWQCLAGVFSPHPHLCINGKVISLSEQHKIIFTGNASGMAGRSSQAIIDEHFKTVQVPQMKREHLRKEVLEEYRQQFNFPRDLIETLLDLHEHCSKVFSAHPGTVRNLKNVLVRIAADREQLKQAFNLPASLLNNFMEIYGGHLTQSQQAALKQWLSKKLKVALRPAPALKAKLGSEELRVNDSVRDLAIQIERELDLRQYLLDNPKDQLLQSSHRTLIIQGPPGRGKDVVAEAVLAAQDMRLGENDSKQPDDTKTFFTITAGVGMPALRKLIDHAKKVGAVVIISELNLLPAEVLEGEFNDLLTGEGAEPGFMLIATINPPSYEGREPLSDAFRNRVRFVEIDDYSRSEQRELLSWRGIKDADAEYIVESHNKLVAQLQSQPRSQRLPTARQLLAVADKLLEKDISVKEAFEETYRFYLLTNQVSAEAEPQKSEQARPDLLALARLWWPDCPWESVTVEDGLPLVTKHNARLKLDAKGAQEAAPYALLAAIAVGKYQKVGTDAAQCCDAFIEENPNMFDRALLLRECGLFLGITEVDAKVPSKLSEDKKPQQLKKDKAPIGEIGSSTGLLESVRDTVAPLATWQNIQESEDRPYLAVSYMDGTAHKELDHVAICKAAKARYGEKPQSKAALSVSMQPNQLANGIKQLPIPTGYAPWVKATIGGKKTEQWGLPNPQGSQITQLTYWLYPIDVDPPTEDKKAELPPRYQLTRAELEQANLLKIIDNPFPQTAQKIAMLQQWIAKNMQYCTTDGLRKQACARYGIEGPTDAVHVQEVLKVGLVVCAESADLLFALLKNFMPEVPVRRVNGYVGDNGDKISSEPHAWVEVFLDGAWKTFDPTPSGGMPMTTPQRQPAAAWSSRGRTSASAPQNLRGDIKGRAEDKKTVQASELQDYDDLSTLFPSDLNNSFFHYHALESAVVYSAEASEGASSVVFSGEKPVFIQQDLDVGLKLRPVVLTHPFLSAKDWHTTGEKIASEMWKKLNENKIKVQAYFPDGSISTLESVEELQTWSRLAIAQPLSAQAIETCRNKFGKAAIVGGIAEVLFRWRNFSPQMAWWFAHSYPLWQPSEHDDPKLGCEVRANLLAYLRFIPLTPTTKQKLVAEMTSWKLAEQQEAYNIVAASEIIRDPDISPQMAVDFVESCHFSDDSYVEQIYAIAVKKKVPSLFEKFKDRDLLHHCTFGNLNRVVEHFLPLKDIELIKLLKKEDLKEGAAIRSTIICTLPACSSAASVERIVAALSFTPKDSTQIFDVLAAKFSLRSDFQPSIEVLQAILRAAKPSHEELDKVREFLSGGGSRTTSLRSLLNKAGIKI